MQVGRGVHILETDGVAIDVPGNGVNLARDHIGLGAGVGAIHIRGAAGNRGQHLAAVGVDGKSFGAGFEAVVSGGLGHADEAAVVVVKTGQRDAVAQLQRAGEALG